MSCMISDVDSEDQSFVMEVSGSKSDEELIMSREKPGPWVNILQTLHISFLS